MADEYDPTDCELGICGPCENCTEQMKIDDTPEGFTGEDPRGDFIELGDEIPEVSNVSGENPNTIGYDTAGQTASANGGRKEEAGTIDLTPSWLAIVGLYLEMLERPEFSAAKRQEMKDEILRAAKLADLYVKEHKR